MSITPKTSIRSLVSYRPEVTALPEGRQIRLSVNEGALGPSPKAVAALGELGETLHRYPEQISQGLVKAIADRFSLKPELILPSNGSDELIGLLATAYLEDGDEAIHTQYGFLVFPQAIRIAGGVAVVAADDGLTVSVDNILAAITPKTRLIFLANPNNPTGTMITTRDVERLIAHVPSSVIIVLDSAYAEYIATNDPDYTDGAAYVETHDNVVMLRTFSKIFGLGSLRLGWGYFPPAILSVLASIRGPFSVNAAAALAGTAAVSDRAFFDRSVAHNNQWMPRMQDSITQAGFDVVPSRANFFLIRFRDADEAEAAHGFMASRGIQLRKMVPYGLPDCLRMSMGDDEEMAITAAAFKDFAETRKS
ncbi:MAG: aminotransferase class I/II-fold pyridoxal phosphate-dependent enzyme [Alphaproteobacteria bacterium]|nr:aminotransferase class I/II-fold pyridoxal phosphate-dependent enzyme [Alphaproteobacteria bacterium]